MFKSLGCSSCHQGVNIGGNLFERQGIFRPLVMGKPDIVRVPSLRNVATTPPYFHDGSAATLNEAVHRMAAPQLDRTLSDQQVNSIVAFLQTLTGTYRGVTGRRSVTMRIPPVVSIAVLLVLLLSWLSVHATNPNAERFDRAFAEIDRFTMLENALYRDVFTARAGTLRNYDPLVREINEMYASLARLRETAAFDTKTAAAIEELAASVVQLEELVEKFKSDNALLHNSLAYFGRFSVRLASSDFGPVISAAAAAILNLTLDTSSAAVREVQERLDELAKQARPSAEDESVGALLVHGRLLNDLLPVTDKTLKAMRAVPRKQNEDALRALVMAQQGASRRTARMFRRVLYGTSLALVGFLVYLAWQLRTRASALQHRAAFEHVIAGISMRFINAPPQNIDAEIERALADMATLHRIRPSLFRDVRPVAAAAHLVQERNDLFCGLAGARA